jgi:hypothetical protein
MGKFLVDGLQLLYFSFKSHNCAILALPECLLRFAVLCTTSLSPRSQALLGTAKNDQGQRCLTSFLTLASSSKTCDGCSGAEKDPDVASLLPIEDFLSAPVNAYPLWKPLVCSASFVNAGFAAVENASLARLLLDVKPKPLKDWELYDSMRLRRAGSVTRLVSSHWATESIDASEAEYDMLGSAIRQSEGGLVKCGGPRGSENVSNALQHDSSRVRGCRWRDERFLNCWRIPFGE